MGEIGFTHRLTKERLAIIKKLGKRRNAGRKPTCTTSQINGHGDLVELAVDTVIGVIISTLLLPETSYGHRVMTEALQH